MHHNFSNNIHFSKGLDEKLVSDARKIVTALRIPSIKQLLREKNMKEAILDVGTHWNTFYYMVSYMLYKYNNFHKARFFLFEYFSKLQFRSQI